ncbi:MAG: TetR/AcrR family transcriptional regulator [Cyanobacteria bacterium]|nr:TetR/AcrR family transcriptional regulator [Cyanobacteriota bacterium]MDA1021565.1 TetR/AcrR family transcriptional regulator [Cyanobacteriota bacterium]
MARRSDHSKEELEKIIFDAANKLIEKDGLNGLSARKLATVIGYTPGTIYSFYENLDELILRVNGKTLDQIYSKLEKSIAKNKARNKAIKAIAESYLNYGQKNINRFRTLFEFNYLQDGKKELPDWYQDKVSKNFGLIEAVLTGNQCSDQSEINAKVLWSGLHGIAMLSLNGKLDSVKLKSSQVLLDSFVEIFLRGLK